MGSGYPVNATDKLHILWKLELTTEWGLDMDLAFIHFWRKSILWHMQFKPTVHPLKTLGSASVGEGGVVDDLNTTQVAYNRRQSINTAVTYTTRPGKEKGGPVDTTIL